MTLEFIMNMKMIQKKRGCLRNIKLKVPGHTHKMSICYLFATMFDPDLNNRLVSIAEESDSP